MAFKNFLNEDGLAFPMAISAVLLLTILLGMLMTALNNELKIRQVTEQRVTAKYLAEAGVEHGIAVLYQAIAKKLEENYPASEPPVTAVPLSELEGYGENIQLIIDGDVFGVYNFQVADAEGSAAKINFNKFFIEDGIYKADPISKTFRIVARGAKEITSGRAYVIEAEVRLVTKLTQGSIAEVIILRWNEIYQ